MNNTTSIDDQDLPIIQIHKWISEKFRNFLKPQVPLVNPFELAFGPYMTLHRSIKAGIASIQLSERGQLVNTSHLNALASLNLVNLQDYMRQPNAPQPDADTAVNTLRATKDNKLHRGLEVLPHDVAVDDNFPETEATYDNQGFRYRVTPQTAMEYQRILTTVTSWGTILAYDRAVYRAIKSLIDVDHFPGLLELLPGLDLYQQLEITATLACRKEGAAIETAFGTLCAQPIRTRTALCKQITTAFALTNGMTILSGEPHATDVIPSTHRSRLFHSWKTTAVNHIADVGERDKAARMLHTSTAHDAIPPSIRSVATRLILGLPLTPPAPPSASGTTEQDTHYVMMAAAPRPLRSIGMAEQRGDWSAIPTSNRPLDSRRAADYIDTRRTSDHTPPEPRHPVRHYASSEPEPTDRELRAAYRQQLRDQQVQATRDSGATATFTGGRSRRKHAMTATAAPSSDDELAPDLPDLVESSDDADDRPGPARTVRSNHVAEVQVQYLNDLARNSW